MPHKNAFDHVRLTAAALVLFSHHFALWGLPEPVALGNSLGHMGVAIFFGLSGFLITQSFISDPHVGRFLLRRALRIMPGLTVNVVVCVIFFGALLTTIPLESYFGHPTTRAFFKNILFNPSFQLPGVLEAAPHPLAVNGSLWTLPFEVAAYILLAAWGSIFRRHLRWLSPWLVVLALCIELTWHPDSPMVVWGNDLRHAPLFLSYFFAGVALSFFASVILKSSNIILLLALYIGIESSAFRHLAAILLVPCLSIYLGLQTINPKLALKNDCSFGVYLYAFPVQQFVIAKWAALGFWPTLAVAALITYALALLSWKFIEKPMLKLKPSNSSLAVPMTESVR